MAIEVPDDSTAGWRASCCNGERYGLMYTILRTTPFQVIADVYLCKISGVAGIRGGVVVDDHSPAI